MFQSLAMTQASCRRSFPRHLLPRIATLAISVVAVVIVQVIYAQAVSGQSSERPNIVLIMADDIGYECLGCYGSRQYQTPRIDRMARQGIRFTHCYSQPLCTPSRVKLMTGLSNVRNYSAFSVFNRGQRTFAHYLQDAGYKTAVAGKWQLLGAEHYPERFRGKGTLPGDAGFDRHCLWQVDKLGERYWGPLLTIDGTLKQFPQDVYGPDVATDYLLDFMAENKDRPFLAYYPMILVHNPFPTTPDSKDRSSTDKQQNFEDMVTYMDKLVGRFVDQAQKLGIGERTMILFIGDNGTNVAISSELNGVTIRGGKGKTTDAGTRVAMVGYCPEKMPAGQVCDDLVDFSDFLPTFCEVSGASPPEKTDGRSFFPQLKGETGNPRDWLHMYYFPRPERTKPSQFVRDQRYKLYSDGRFYDVTGDVMEAKPLKNVQPGSPAARAREKLTAALEQFPGQGQSLLKFTP